MDWQNLIADAAKRIEPFIVKTPIFSTKSIYPEYNIELKFEHLQHTGSFKPRGAFNSLLSAQVPETGVVAASGGNHGAAVAFAATTLGYPAHIFVPKIAGKTKIDLIKNTGAELTIVEGAYANALIAAEKFEQETGAMQVHAFDSVETTCGQGTLMHEWEQQGLEADTILIAVGGGGLIAGSMAWLQGRRKVIAVEPIKSSALSSALKAGKPIDVDVSGIASNALGAKKAGNICFQLAKEQDILALTIKDEDIALAQILLWDKLRQFVEPAAATALAALTSGAYIPKENEKVAVLICGGNPPSNPFN
jgi:threonine dehydratase|tara:strand:+ start:139 stop:1059 length:921 start_codon:yes stop_codon:yes gene_type:complete